MVRFPAGARDFNIYQDVQIGCRAHPVSDPRGIGGFFIGDMAFGVWN
jgi:hypothetical protein